jgi:hypothetical protein
MSNISWPYHALGEDGKFYSPVEAKQLGGKYHCGLLPDVELVPCVGEINQPYWRSASGHSYSDNRPGWEMTPWHYEIQQTAVECGLVIEQRIEFPDGSWYVADAYDKTSNTVYEFVNTCYDGSKIRRYQNSGFNQVWVFIDYNSKWSAAFDRIRSIDPLLYFSRVSRVNNYHRGKNAVIDNIFKGAYSAIRDSMADLNIPTIDINVASNSKDQSWIQ